MSVKRPLPDAAKVVMYRNYWRQVHDNLLKHTKELNETKAKLSKLQDEHTSLINKNNDLHFQLAKKRGLYEH